MSVITSIGNVDGFFTWAILTLSFTLSFYFYILTLPMVAILVDKFYYHGHSDLLGIVERRRGFIYLCFLPSEVNSSDFDFRTVSGFSYIIRMYLFYYKYQLC